MTEKVTIAPERDSYLFEIMSAALHEMCHAKVNERKKLGNLKIKVDGPGCGMVTIEKSFIPAGGSPEGHMMASAAGYVGESWWLKKHYGLSWGKALNMTSGPASHDIRNLRELQKEFGYPIQKAEEKAFKLLKQHWRFIESKSVALAEKAVRNGGKAKFGFWGIFFNNL